VAEGGRRGWDLWKHLGEVLDARVRPFGRADLRRDAWRDVVYDLIEEYVPGWKVSPNWETAVPAPAWDAAVGAAEAVPLAAAAAAAAAGHRPGTKVRAAADEFARLVREAEGSDTALVGSGALSPPPGPPVLTLTAFDAYGIATEGV
jgi:hypothetical protein